MNEFELIAAMRDRWGPLAVDIGDDAAVLRVSRGESLVASTDAALEGVHCRLDWLTPRECAYRAVTAALSDLAAMAASPIGVLLAMQLPPARADVLPELADGAADAVRAAGTVIVGGNLSAGDAVGITTTVLGTAFAPLRRAGARAGDTLYVTGLLGGPAAAVRALSGGRTLPDSVRSRFAGPRARIAEGRWLALAGATAAIDISDGLAADAGHLAEASGAALEIDVDRVPVFEGATVDDALAGGEEYELLVAARARLDEDAFQARFGLPLTQIGRVADGPAGMTLTRRGARVAVPPGYDHFSR